MPLWNRKKKQGPEKKAMTLEEARAAAAQESGEEAPKPERTANSEFSSPVSFANWQMGDDPKGKIEKLMGELEGIEAEQEPEDEFEQARQDQFKADSEMRSDDENEIYGAACQEGTYITFAEIQAILKVMDEGIPTKEVTMKMAFDMLTKRVKVSRDDLVSAIQSGDESTTVQSQGKAYPLSAVQSAFEKKGFDTKTLFPKFVDMNTQNDEKITIKAFNVKQWEAIREAVRKGDPQTCAEIAFKQGSLLPGAFFKINFGAEFLKRLHALYLEKNQQSGKNHGIVKPGQDVKIAQLKAMMMQSSLGEAVMVPLFDKILEDSK